MLVLTLTLTLTSALTQHYNAIPTIKADNSNKLLHEIMQA